MPDKPKLSKDELSQVQNKVSEAVTQEPSMLEKAADTTKAGLYGIGKAATFGQASKLAGAVGAAKELMAPSDKRPQNWEELKKAYEDAKQYAEKEYAQSEEAHPIATRVGESIGMAATLPVGGGSGAALKGVSAFPKIAALAGKVPLAERTGAAIMARAGQLPKPATLEKAREAVNVAAPKLKELMKAMQREQTRQRQLGKEK